MFVPLALAALIIEAMIGYPARLYAAIGHPISWIGAVISVLDRNLNRESASFAARKVAGCAALLILLLVTGSTAVALTMLLDRLTPPLGLLGLAAVASTLLAQRSLHEHVGAVADALDQDGLAGGRLAVAQIVGRDPASLDEAGVSRAAIESLAENFSDGIVAPLFWLVIGGLPGAALYKAINTADSMIGHKSSRYLAFGWAAARLDDLVNLPASRLGAIFIVIAAGLLPSMSAAGALGAVRRDAGRHRSPNAGWPEAAMAGALDLRLAGPRRYAGEVVDDHWMGDGRAEVTSADIRRALLVYRLACGLQIGVLGVIVLIMTVAR